MLCLLLAVSLAIPAFAASVSFSMSASNKTLSRGDTVTLSVSVSSSAEATTYGLKLSYDTNVFELVNGACSVPGTLVSSFNNGFAFMFQSAQAYSGSVGTVTLKVKDTASLGSYTVSGIPSVKNGSDTVSASSGSVSLTVACDHSYGSWTAGDNGHQQTCSLCGNVNTQAHSWNNGTVTKPATCQAEGVMTYACTVCGASKTESIPKTNEHSFDDPTFVNENEHTATCSVCHQQVTEPHNWDSGTVTKPATCSQTGVLTKNCPDCGGTKTETIPVTDTHNFGAWANLNSSSHKRTCADCGKAETASHSWNNGAITKPATCKEDGVKTYTCTGCNGTKTEVLPKTDSHTWGKWSKLDSTSHKRSCSVCAKQETEAHQYGSAWSKDTAGHWHECEACKDKKDFAVHTPGPEATASTPQTCTICKYVLKPAQDHTHDYEQTWTSDETGHWYICSGCEEKGSFAPHSFENPCDPACSICGYIRENVHSFGETWETDAENHWKLCTGCGLIQEKAAHMMDGDQPCAICGYQKAPEQTTETEPEKNDSFHLEDEEEEKPQNPDASILWILLILGLLAGVCGVVVTLKNRR